MEYSIKQARALLWQKGVLSWKLDDTQKELYQSFLEAKQKSIVWSCSRRLGKSYTLCVLALETCLKTPNSVVKYVAPEQKMVRTIIKPIMRDILRDCPENLAPEFKTNENIYRFNNGSEIQLAGTDNGNAESLRGGSANLCVVDEAGFCDDLRYVVQSILIPTTTMSKGKVILASTPPKSQGHDFYTYIKEADFRGSLIKKTIYDNKRMTSEMLQEIIDEYGGIDSVDFRREYLVEQITDEDHAVVPEFTETLAQKLTMEWPRPPFFDVYVAGDIGFNDLTVLLFAYYDFRAAKLIIEDELVMSGAKMTTKALAEAIKAKEEALYTIKMTGDQLKPYLRVCDNNLIVINDLYKLHGLQFNSANKDDNYAALNNMRIMLKSEGIIIHPRCKTLIFHLKNATWNKSRKSYDRSADAGHYDAIDALKYLIRTVQYSKNPYPSHYGMGSRENIWQSPNINKGASPHNAWREMFKIRRSLPPSKK